MSIRSVSLAVDRYAKAKPELRRPMWDSAISETLELANERDIVKARLGKRWDWCDANPEHPEITSREDAVLVDLAMYEAMEDALRDAGRALLGGPV